MAGPNPSHSFLLISFHLQFSLVHCLSWKTKAFDLAQPGCVAAGCAPHDFGSHLPRCCGGGRLDAAAPRVDAAVGAVESQATGSKWEVDGCIQQLQAFDHLTW